MDRFLVMKGERTAPQTLGGDAAAVDDDAVDDDGQGERTALR